MNLKTTFQNADQNWQNGTTTYWFEVNFEVYNKGNLEYDMFEMVLGVVESGCDEPKIIDDEGYPIEGDWIECYVDDLVEHVTDDIRKNAK